MGRSCCGGWGVHPSLLVQQVVEHSFPGRPGVEQTHHSLWGRPTLWQKTCEWTQSCTAPQPAQQALWWNCHSVKTKAVCPCLRYQPSQEQVRCRQVHAPCGQTRQPQQFSTHMLACLADSHWLDTFPPASNASVYSSESSKSVSCTSTGGNCKLENGKCPLLYFFFLVICRISNKQFSIFNKLPQIMTEIHLHQMCAKGPGIRLEFSSFSVS